MQRSFKNYRHILKLRALNKKLRQINVKINLCFVEIFKTNGPEYEFFRLIYRLLFY